MALKNKYFEITDKYKQQDKSLCRVIYELLPPYTFFFFLEQKYYKTFPHFSQEYLVSFLIPFLSFMILQIQYTHKVPLLLPC